jgi:hypothetical protein
MDWVDLLLCLAAVWLALVVLAKIHLTLTMRARRREMAEGGKAALCRECLLRSHCRKHHLSLCEGAILHREQTEQYHDGV